jgi:ribosomal protein S12 methylthiotransferase
MTASREHGKVGFVSLGCPKALVDSERILTQLRVEGYAVAPDYQSADLVVVNTCGFIDAAVTESLEAIAEAMEQNGKVIVTGCLGVKGAEIRARFPKVLAVTGPQRYEDVMTAVHQHLPQPHEPYLDLVPPQGVKLTPRHYAYLKVAEGCDHKCSFCIIPSMRGRLASRLAGDVLREAERLVAGGVREILVISQDTSAYGADVRYRVDTWRDREVATRLQDLTVALGDLGVWIRLHYVYPYPHVDALIPLMAEGKIVPYLDVPFQHASPRILKLMRRPAATEDNLRRIEAWRAICPEITIRSTFIVGFPGETEEDFEYLLEFGRAAQLDRVGCFEYSPVAGAAANALPDPVPETVKQERYARFMQQQAGISRARLAAKLGQRVKVLIDEVTAEEAIARSAADAPEIDGKVYIDGPHGLQPGNWAHVEIIDHDDYDCWGRIVQGPV